MSQNKVRKHLETLSTRTKREQKFVKDETENRQVPILKINIRNHTVCEVERTDYLNRRIASKNEDNEDKNISCSESIFHKFPENISDKEPRHDIVESFESNFNKLAKCIGNSDKGTENISNSTHAFKNDILKETAIVKSSKEKDSNLGGNEKSQKRKINNFSNFELQESISEGKQKRRKINNSGSNLKSSLLQVQQCSKAVPHKFYTQSDSNAAKLVEFTKKCNEMEKFIKNKPSFIPISRNEVSRIFIENVSMKTSLIKWDHSYASSTLHESSKKFKPYSVKVNDYAGNVKEMCDKYMDNYIKYKTEKYRDEEYTDEELVLFPYLSRIEMYFKQDLPDE
ncbi:hypothetical protein CDAR_488631 [Caerostris darwini]|uniref:Uncharacterized protein n=1 Tax=Caerostris darwini TaxID=1538125 RepID=A0AAV4SB07_9ARAC|nr:hypothetical protein CDAR_488631 [Caerostris darwini]